MKPERLKLQTWFGLTATVELSGSRWLHRAGFGRWLLPHPPLFNLILRTGMTETDYRRQSIRHEWGHFQVMPVILLYLVAGTVIFFPLARNPAKAGIWFLGIFPLWEILAEAHVLWQEKADYRRAMRGIPIWRKILFWAGNAFATAVTWGVLF